MTTRFLESALLKTENLKDKVDLYNRFFYAHRDDSPLLVLDRTEKAMALSHRSAYSRGVFETMIHRAYSYLQISEKNRAEEDIGRIKQLYREDSGWERENMYFYHLLCLYYGGRIRPALCSDYAYRCLVLSRKLSCSAVSASVQAVQGRMNYKLHRYDEAEKCYLSALGFLKSEQNVLLEGIIHCHLGDLFAHMGHGSRPAVLFTGDMIS